MNKESLYKQIKDSMRIKHNALDNQIQTDIEAATLDLVRAGVQPYKNAEKKELRNDALIHKALELYCKAEADYQGKGEKYRKAYEKLSDSLSLCGDYNE